MKWDLCTEDDSGGHCIRCGDEIYTGDKIQWRYVNPEAPRDSWEGRLVGMMHLDCAAAEDNPR